MMKVKIELTNMFSYPATLLKSINSCNLTQEAALELYDKLWELIREYEDNKKFKK